VQAGRRFARDRYRHEQGRGALRPCEDAGRGPVIDVQAEDPLERILELTGSRGVDVVLDCTAGAGVAPVLLGIVALKRRAGTLPILGELAAFPEFRVKKLTEKAITIKSARPQLPCELALAQVAFQRFPLDLLTAYALGLGEVDRAIRTVAGEGDDGVVHVSLLPWRDRLRSGSSGRS
jgi:threonine dehydrogenase-like Zn-dependent dehydrogenase